MHRPQHDSTSGLRGGGKSADHIVDVVVLTADSGLLATIREAASAEHALWHAPSADVAVDLLVGGRCGILLADLDTLRGDVSALLERLQLQFPELVLIASGRREQENAVSALLTSGPLYRFLHKPVSPPRAHLFLSAATRRYSELRNVEPLMLTTVKLIVRRPKPWLLLAIALCAVVAALLFFFIWYAQQRSAPVRLATPAVSGQSRPQQVAEYLGRAQIAFAAGRLSEPRGDNALDYYRAVLAMDAQHRNAQAGIQSVVAALEQKVDVALRARNASQTLAALKVLERAQPSHPRLATAHAELLALSKPRRPATTPLVQPAAAPPPVKAEATPHLDAAIALIAAGQLVTPSNDNAFAHLRLARDAQQNDTRVRIAATDLGARLLQRAAQALKSGDADLAREMLDAARLVDDEFQLHLPEMEKVTREVIGAPVANETLLQELATALHYRERDQLIEPAGANAYDAVIALRQRYPQLDAVRSEQQRLAITLLERTRTAIAAREIDTAATLLQRADTLVPGMSATRGLSQQIAIARGERDAAPKVLQAMDLPRVSEVAAQYPTEVEREGREGWVDVDFTIAVDGSTEDLVVREASPAGIFDQAALDALRQWRFEPILNAGTPVKQRATIRVKFALQ